MNLPKIIAITGRAGAGKDTLAEELELNYEYTVLRFADPLKDMVCTLLGIDREELENRERKEDPVYGIGGASRRRLMQTLGTEWGRQYINTDLWATATIQRAIEAVQEGRHVVIPDCRFINEAEAIRKAGGVVLEVSREAHIVDQQTLNHSSEAPLPRSLIDGIVRNDSSIEDLKLRLQLRLETLASL